MSDQEQINDVYLSIRRHLVRIVSRIVPPKDIEDIVQETYVRLCLVKKKEKIRAPRAFLFKTAHNLALDHIKRAEVRLVDSIEENPEPDYGESEHLADTIFHQVASSEEFALFCEAVRGLPVQCRKSFVLKKVYGYSQREISKQLNISESTVEKHIATGIKRCTCFMMQQDVGTSVIGNARVTFGTHKEGTP